MPSGETEPPHLLVENSPLSSPCGSLLGSLLGVIGARTWQSLGWDSKPTLEGLGWPATHRHHSSCCVPLTDRSRLSHPLPQCSEAGCSLCVFQEQTRGGAATGSASIVNFQLIIPTADPGPGQLPLFTVPPPITVPRFFETLASSIFLSRRKGRTTCWSYLFRHPYSRLWALMFWKSGAY